MQNYFGKGFSRWYFSVFRRSHIPIFTAFLESVRCLKLTQKWYNVAWSLAVAAHIGTMARRLNACLLTIMLPTYLLCEDRKRNLYVNLERFRCISLPVSTPGVRAVLPTNYPSILVTDFEEIYKYQKQCI